MTTQDAVIEIITREQKCSSADISMTENLEDLGVDSLKAITILYLLEEQFNIEIPNETIESISTVGDIVDRINELR